MSETLTSDALQDLLLVDNPHALNSILEDAHPHDIAQAADDLDDQSLWRLLRQLAPPTNGDVFAHLPPDRQIQLIETQAPQEVADLLEVMPSDDRVDLIQRLAPQPRQRVLQQMEEPQRRDVESLAVHAEGTAGSVMSTDVATLRSNTNVNDAIERLRSMARQKETIYYNYVVDPQGRLLGIISLRDLVLAEGHMRLEEIMNQAVLTVSVDDPVEEIARKIREYDLLALPVIERDGRLAGIVTVDDVLDVAEQEATEDFHKIGATGLGKVSLTDASLWLLYRRRIVWLIVLVFVNVISGAGIALYEETIHYVVPLVFFLPLLIDSGGNAGSQAATLMVRALATGDVVMKDWFRMLAKEFSVALGLGVTMAAGVAVVSAFRAPEVMVIVASTMVIIVVVGSLIGMLLPFIFTRLNADPATASGPLITSLADITGVLIYFSLATWVLRDQIEAARAAAQVAAH